MQISKSASNPQKTATLASSLIYFWVGFRTGGTPPVLFAIVIEAVELSEADFLDCLSKRQRPYSPRCTYQSSTDTL